jgi:predicted lipoprotein
MKKTALILCLMASVFACKPKDSGTDDKTFDTKAMLTNIGNNMIVPAYASFKVNVDDLSTATDTFVNNPSVQNLQALRLSFKNAYIGFQKCDVFAFGPASDAALRANVNIYPTDTTKIQSNIQSGFFTVDFLSNAAAKGFPAIDYLLDYDGKSDAEVVALYASANRKQYLQAVVASIKTKVDTIVTGWSTYINTFIASTSYSLGSSPSLLINAMNIYYEAFIRDGKIAIPLGIKSGGSPLPEQTEAYYGGFSVELLNVSLQTFQDLYLGKYGSTNGLGLDDNLIAVDGASIDDAIKSDLADALAACSALSDPLSQTIISEQASVNTAYLAVKKVIIPLKVDMPSKLGVLISYQDNDGD